MADKSMNVDGEVSWKRSNGNPTETVEEVATSSATATESENGNAIKESTIEGYPVVPIGQDGDGAVKPTSEPEKEGYGENIGDRGNGTEGVKKEPETGEKRGRGDVDGGPEIPSEEEHNSAEKAEGRDAKKPRTGEVEDAGTENGSINNDGNADEKDGKREVREGDPTAKVAEKEEQKAPKKRGPGRPKKSESKVEKTAPSVKETNDSDSVGKRTRSKA
ncbi:MAG: hypothetical protein M1839_006197 [Geoglossum umbratile]|nr:MAG: hypothetical protein M1839_006197 [Geoglossum umbratile]